MAISFVLGIPVYLLVVVWDTDIQASEVVLMEAIRVILAYYGGRNVYRWLTVTSGGGS